MDTERDLRAASQAVDGAESARSLKQAKAQNSARTYRKFGASWTAPPVMQNGEVLIPNLKHGPNILHMEAGEFPPYHEIRPEHIDRSIEWMARLNAIELWALYKDVPLGGTPTWHNFMEALEVITDKVDRVFDIIQHVIQVRDPSPKMMKAWKYAQDVRWRLLRRVRRSETLVPHFHELLRGSEATEAQRRAVAAQLILFEQDGVALFDSFAARDDPVAFKLFLRTRNHLHNISLEWDLNIASDMAQKAFLVRNADELKGVPMYVLEDAAAAARRAGYPKATPENGPWKIHFDDAMVQPILRFAEGRSFREFIYGAKTRIAFLGGSGKGDNSAHLMDMLRGRLKYANLIGYATYADMAFTMKMASLQQAYGFLARLRREALPVAKSELKELRELARSRGVREDIDHFDVAYWRERLLEERFGLREDYLRPFFQMPVVLEGLWKLLHRLFGVQVVAADSEVEVWDKHVRFYRVREEDTGELLGSFFLDAYRRRGSKKAGFWVQRIQGYSTRLSTSRGPRRPAVHIVCDIAPPGDDGRPALLTHREVAEVFHTVGSSLRHLLCRQREGLVAGTSGLEADAVGLPAHLLRRFAYDEGTLRSISRHVETGDALPEPAIKTIAVARTFHSGMPVLKRTAMAQIDIDLHGQYDPNGAMGVYDVAELIEAEFSVIPPRVEDHELASWPLNDEDRACALYADLWSEALAADAFSEFEAVGLDDAEAVGEVGRRFREAVLEPGGGRAPTNAFRDFLGRPPSFASFLRHLGLEGGPADSSQEYEDEYEDVYEEDSDYVEYETEELGDEEDEDFPDRGTNEGDDGDDDHTRAQPPRRR